MTSRYLVGMTLLNKVMPRLVTAFAIRSWRDLVLKVVLFFILVNFGAYLADTSLFSSDGRLGWAADLWTVTLVAAPVLAFQLGVVTYLEQLQRKLEGAEMRDSLTGLPNRRAFMNRTKTGRLLHPQGTVILLDVDAFKRINDAYGHEFGDLCLIRVADALRDNTNDTDIIGRLNGTEFAAFIPAHSKTDVAQFTNHMATQLSRRIQQTHANGGRNIPMTLSVGLVLAGPHHAIELLLSHADTALHAAKDKGRGQVVEWEDMPSAMRQAS